MSRSQKKSRKRFPRAVEKAIYEKYKHRCAICGEETDFDKGDLDHIISLGIGGDDTPENLQWACHRCNKLKSERRTNEEVRKMLGLPEDYDEQLHTRTPRIVFFDDFESEKMGLIPSKWLTSKQKGSIRISDGTGAEGTSKVVTISSPNGSVEFIERKIKPQSKLVISYCIRQETFGKSGVGAAFQLFSGSVNAIWMGIRFRNLDYYSHRYRTIWHNIEIGTWYRIRVEVDCSKGTFNCNVNDTLALSNGRFRNKVDSIDTLRSTVWNRQDSWSTSIDQIMIVISTNTRL